MRFLTVGDGADLTLGWAARLAADKGLEPLTLTEDGFGVDWRPAPHSNGLGVELAEGGALAPTELGPALVRFNPLPGAPEGVAEDQLDRHLFAKERRSGLHRFLLQAPYAICNPPFAGSANASKPLQMAMLSLAGFRIPPWIATNDPAAAEAFVAANGPCVAKAVSGMRSQVKPFGDDHRAALEDGTAPFLIQRRAEGVNVRIHAFGSQCFATRVESHGVLDYRFEDAPSEWTPIRAPAAIERLCLDYLETERLIIGGFDFLAADLDDPATWSCLECNPAPTFITYEVSARQPIGGALIDHLTAMGRVDGHA